MRFVFVSPLLLLTAACNASTPAAGTDKPAPAAVTHPALSPEADYAAKLDNRTSAIIKELGITDETKASAVKQILSSQYRALHDWQETNEKRVKELKNASHDKDAAVAAKAKSDLEELMDTRKALRVNFLAALAKQLTPEQVTHIKDLMTYNKVKVTFTVYCEQNPWFSEENKAKVKAWLVEAREEAIDGGSAEEKSDIFNKYKGRINNYISKNKPAK